MTVKTEALMAEVTRRTPGGVAEVAALAYPAVLQTLSDTLMQVVDAAIVGRLGVTELGAVGFGGIWVWTTLVAFVGTATGVQTFAARAFGAGRDRECGQWVWHGLYALVPAAILWTILLSFAFPSFLHLLGPTPELQALANRYAQARFFGSPAIVANVVLTSFFRGFGDTRTPLFGTVVANLVNAAAAYSLVFGLFGLPALGVAGAGAATSLANWLYAGIMLTALLRHPVARRFATEPIRPALHAIRRYLRTSAPIGGQWVLDMGSFAIFSTIIARMGNTEIAANQAMIQLLSLSFMQAFGISIASGALVGRYVGARDFAAAERSHQSALKLGVALAAIVAVLFVSIPDALLGVFTTDSAVLAIGRPLLALAAVFQLVDAAGIIAGGSLRGAGDTRWPFAVQASLAWCLRLPLVYLLAIVLDGGVHGAWLGELGYIAVLCALWFLRIRAGHWRTMRI